MADPNKKKLLIFSSSLAGGGAEKHLLRILPDLQRHYETTLALCRYDGELVSDIPQGSTIIELGKGRTLKALIPLIIFLRRNQPDLIFSIQDHANAIALVAKCLSFSKKLKTACSVQNNFSISSTSTPLVRSKILYSLLPWFYQYADCLITCSEGLKTNLVKHLTKTSAKIVAIHNAAYEHNIPEQKKEQSNEPWLINKTIPVIISCGRLVPQKNFPLLLQAFKNLTASIDARLIIVGNGPEKTTLETMVIGLGLSNKVKFLPFTLNHYQLISRADVFVLPSLWEGFGNIIVEAMACEVPVIASNCPFGPNEIVEHNKDGLLFENNNQDALTASMLLLLSNPATRHELVQAAKEKCKQFASDKIAEKHIHLFDSLLCQK